MNLSRRQRVLATLVLAAGASASIATSMAPVDPILRWSLTEVADLPPITYDESNPRVGFLVQVTFDGAMQRPSGNLNLSLNVALDPTLAAPASVHVEMIEVATGSIGTIDFVQQSNVTVAPGLGMPAWRLDCRQGCFNEFEVWIERTDELAGEPWNPALISGVFDIELNETLGDATTPPEGSNLTVFVTPL